MEDNLCKLTEEWHDLKNIVIYGAGTVSKICGELFKKVDVEIICVIDQDKEKQGKCWNGIPIISFEQAKKTIIGRKIVVMTAHTAYNEISQFLDSNGLKEYRDYCEIGQFICEWFWYAKQMNCVYHVDMTVTTRCTFRCRHCNMFIPFYKEQKDYTFEELKRNVDLLFGRLDYIVHFGILGGETFLCPSLKDIVAYIGENYKDKYGTLSLTTNGGIVPADDLFEIIKKYNIHLLISDYTKEIGYNKKLNQLIQKAELFKILYEVRRSIVWCDFGFPESPVFRKEEQLRKHLHSCHPEWNGLNDGNFYYCNVSWSAEKSGHYKLEKDDYIKLEDIDAEDKEACHKIVELSRGTSSFCNICGGCGIDNTSYVPAGVQL